MQDRGLDNWMIKICWHSHENEDHSHANGVDSGMSTLNGKNGGPLNYTPTVKTDQPVPAPALVDVRASDPLTSRTGTPLPETQNDPVPHIHIGAIDNSLAFPWKHPDEWRSFPLYILQIFVSNI